MNKHIIPILIVLLLVSSGFVGVSNNIEEKEQEMMNEDYSFYHYNEHDYPEGYLSNKRTFVEHAYDVKLDVLSEPEETTKTSLIETKEDEKPLAVTSGSLVGSPWPMYCHDTRHTGCSPYSTVDTWDEVWNFETYGWAEGGPVIDNDGTIYIGAYSLYAIHPNGNLKWKFDTIFTIRTAPAIDENGNIYFGTIYGEPSYLYAVYPNGTLKWKYSVGGMYSIFSSPVIGNDGTIYFGSGGGYPATGSINAVYPNGSLKWKYDTNHVVYSSPAIGLDGTIYCGSHDNYVYALYPNNGTLKWKYNTGSWVHGSPTIADDGTVYIGSDNGYLYAFYPNNGTVKWKVNIGAVYASPALDKDGNLYVGAWEKKFYAIYPNGTIKWSFNTGGGKVWGSSAALSEEGTIYFSTCDLEWTGGIEIIALYTDSTVKWRKGLDTVFSSPAIAEDGTVYIGSCSPPGEGFLNAFGVGELEADAHGPYYGLVIDPVQFEGSSKGGYSPHSFHWDFGDGNTSDEQNPTHIYTYPGNFTVTLTVTDNSSNTSYDTTWAWIQASNDPPNKPSIDGKINGKVGVEYDYTFETTDPEGLQVWYYIEWGDDTNTGWLGPYGSGEEITKSHSWSEKDTYTIRCKAKDPYEAESEWSEFEVSMPMNQQSGNMWFLRWLERFPLLNQIICLLMEKWI